MLVNKEEVIVEVCTRAVQVEKFHACLALHLRWQSLAHFYGCKGGNRTACTCGCKKCQGIGATGNVGQVLCRHRETKEKAHCPGYLEQRIIRRTWWIPAVGLWGAQGTGARAAKRAAANRYVSNFNSCLICWKYLIAVPLYAINVFGKPNLSVSSDQHWKWKTTES